MRAFLLLFSLFLFFSIYTFAQELSPEEIANKLRPATVKIVGELDEKDLLKNDHREWSGTGVIVGETSTEYIIATNLHVLGFWIISELDKMSQPDLIRFSIQVVMHNERHAYITKIAINSLLKDFALIYIDKSVGQFTVIPLSDKRVNPGNKVYAMGHPLGLNYTFTSGIVSNIIMDKSELGSNYQLIQTDTPINSGNSGGPLMDSKGDLVGINVAKISTVGVEGLNFAISAFEIINSLKSNEFLLFPDKPKEIGRFVWQLRYRKLKY